MVCIFLRPTKLEDWSLTITNSVHSVFKGRLHINFGNYSQKEWNVLGKELWRENNTKHFLENGTL